MRMYENKNSLNIEFDNTTDIKLFKDIYGTHVKVGDTVIGDFPSVKKVEDYLYEITVDDLDEEYFLETEKSPYAIGACSQFRNGNIIGRHYDWLYSNNVEFIVKTLPKDGRHASIGVSSSNITKNNIENKVYDENFKDAMYHILDGINDCGVYCASNVVPTGDKGLTIGTNPEGKPLPCIGVPRFILDNATSAKHAIELLKTRNIHSVKYDDSIIELHYLICDATDTFIVEFVDNEMSVLSFPDKKTIMTNYYITGWDTTKGIRAKWLGNTDAEIAETGLTPHADGLERYLLLQAEIDNVSDYDSAASLLQKVKYTKAYDASQDPFWYSELTGKYPEGELTIYTDEDKFTNAKAYWIQQFNERTREGSPTWQTVHSAVYDLQNKKFTVVVQEGTEQHTYALDVN